MTTRGQAFAVRGVWPQRILVMTLMGVGLVALFTPASPASVRLIYNVSDSAPRGFYAIRHDVIRHGDWLLTRLPADAARLAAERRQPVGRDVDGHLEHAGHRSDLAPLSLAAQQILHLVLQQLDAVSALEFWIVGRVAGLLVGPLFQRELQRRLERRFEFLDARHGMMLFSALYRGVSSAVPISSRCRRGYCWHGGSG